MDGIDDQPGLVDRQPVKPPGRRWARVELSVEVLGLLLQMPEGARISHLFVNPEAGGRTISIVVSHADLAVVEPGAWIPTTTVWMTVIDGRPVFDWRLGDGHE